MSSAGTLVEAIAGLAPAQFPTFDGQAPSTAGFPRVILAHHLPGVVSRSEAGSVHGRAGRVVVTIASTSTTSVRVVWDAVFPAFDQARVSAEGWLTSPLRMLEDVLRVFPDRDVTLPSSNALAMVGVATFEYTVTEI